MGTKIVNILRKRGKFLVLHLRYEKDMLAYTGCPDGCTSQESQELQNLRSLSLSLSIMILERDDVYVNTWII